jgi:hypothetical protein
MSEGGKTDKKYTMGYRMGQIIPDQFVYSYKKFIQKLVDKKIKPSLDPPIKILITNGK